MRTIAHLVIALALLVSTAGAGSDGEIQALIDAAADPAAPEEARAGAVARLADEGPAAAALLAARLRFSDPAIRAAAAAVLGELPAAALADDRIAPVLLEVFQRDPDAAVRANAGLALGATGDHRALAPLLSALASDDRLTRLTAARALRRLGDRDATAPLAAAFATERDAEIQRAIVVALGGLGAFRELIAVRAAAGDEAVTAEIDAQLAPVRDLMRHESEVARAAQEAEAATAAPPTPGQRRYAFLQAHRVLLVRLAVLLLITPSLMAGVLAGRGAALRRVAMMIVAATLAVAFGGLFSAGAVGLAHADPGGALVAFIPFLEALMTMPVAMCAATVQPALRTASASAAVNGAAWSALYAALQFGSWALVPAVLDGHSFWNGQHPDWAATHVAHALGIMGAVLLAGSVAARLHAVARLDLPRYGAMLAAAGAALGLGYLIVNLYAY